LQEQHNTIALEEYITRGGTEFEIDIMLGSLPSRMKQTSFDGNHVVGKNSTSRDIVFIPDPKPNLAAPRDIVFLPDPDPVTPDGATLDRSNEDEKEEISDGVSSNEEKFVPKFDRSEVVSMLFPKGYPSERKKQARKARGQKLNPSMIAIMTNATRFKNEVYNVRDMVHMPCSDLCSVESLIREPSTMDSSACSHNNSDQGTDAPDDSSKNDSISRRPITFGIERFNKVDSEEIIGKIVSWDPTWELLDSHQMGTSPAAMTKSKLKKLQEIENYDNSLLGKHAEDDSSSEDSSAYLFPEMPPKMIDFQRYSKANGSLEFFLGHHCHPEGFARVAPSLQETWYDAIADNNTSVSDHTLFTGDFILGHHFDPTRFPDTCSDEFEIAFVEYSDDDTASTFAKNDYEKKDCTIFASETTSTSSNESVEIAFIRCKSCMVGEESVTIAEDMCSSSSSGLDDFVDCLGNESIPSGWLIPLSPVNSVGSSCNGNFLDLDNDLLELSYCQQGKDKGCILSGSLGDESPTRKEHTVSTTDVTLVTFSSFFNTPDDDSTEDFYDSASVGSNASDVVNNLVGFCTALQ
jgi:hypothetical protein